MISIIIPLYNKEMHIGNTLKSVFVQTFQDFELIIVNDGSTDGSVEVVQEFADNRIRLIHQKNQGVSAARNRGIQEAKYEYIALLDADDEWKPEYLQTQVGLIKKYPKCSVFACAYEFLYSDGKTKSVILNKIPFEGEDGLLSNYFEVASCSHPPICSISIVARRDAFMSVGGFPAGVTAGEDLLTWAKLALNYSIAYSLKSQAFFIFNRDDVNKPRKLPDKNDFVGREFIKLYSKFKAPYMKEYISRWYQMRAVNYYEGKKRLLAFLNIQKSIVYNATNVKNYIWIALFFLPNVVYKRLRKIK